ncbi:MAG: DUF6134 family protein [Cyclobacteriaceae bacterium]
MRRVTILIFLFQILLWSAHGQNLRYEIVKGDKIIGSLDAKKIVDKDRVTYTLKNRVEFKVLFSFSVQYDLEETFSNGILISGKGKNSLNDASQKETSIEKNETGYLLFLDGTPNHLNDKKIEYSVSRIYHEEPFDGKAVFSEYFGYYLHIEKIGENRYLLRSPDGENEYTYSQGYCTEVKVSRDFATFYIRMDDTTLAQLNEKSTK